MSATYTLKGSRFLRKYTAGVKTPTTSAGSDAAAIGENICRFNWEEVSPLLIACFPSYTSTDDNAAARDSFDAAEWCAEHDTQTKTHRAFANACIYRFELPEGAQAVTLESVDVSVTCDPYTPQGARIAAMCTDSEELPSNCSTVRTMSAHHEGVSPRTSATDDSGNTFWYEHTETKTLELNETGKKYLLIFIGLETYRARNGWLEGAAKIGSVTATFSDCVTGWSEDDPADCRPSARHEFPVIRRGVLPSTVDGCAHAVQVQLNGDALTDGKTQMECGEDGAVIGLGALYSRFYSGDLKEVPASMIGSERPGASFCVRNWRVGKDGSPVWQLATTALLVPFAAPRIHKAAKVRLEWSGLRHTSGSTLCVWMKRGQYVTKAESLANPDLYTGETAEGWDLVGRIAATENGPAEFDLDARLEDAVATLLVTAYLPVDAIDFDAFFPQGVGNVDFDLASSTVEGVDTAFMPDITLLCY